MEMEKGEFMKEYKERKSVSELFAGDLAVRIPGFQFHCCDPGSIPGQGTEIPHAEQCWEKKLYQIMKYKVTTTAAAKLLQSSPTLCDSIDCSPPGSYVHGIVQTRILEWTAMKKRSHVEGCL